MVASHEETRTSRGPRLKAICQSLKSSPETIAGAVAIADGEGPSPLGAAVAGLEEDGAASWLDEAIDRFGLRRKVDLSTELWIFSLGSREIRGGLKVEDDVFIFNPEHPIYRVWIEKPLVSRANPSLRGKKKSALNRADAVKRSPRSTEQRSPRSTCQTRSPRRAKFAFLQNKRGRQTQARVRQFIRGGLFSTKKTAPHPIE